jgi:hypothetical protein
MEPSAAKSFCDSQRIDMKVSAIAALFGTTCVPYVEFVKSKYKNDWMKQLTKRPVPSKGTDVPIWTEEMCGDSQSHQHFASLQKATRGEQDI